MFFCLLILSQIGILSFMNGGKLKSLTKIQCEGLMSIPEMGLNLDHRVVEFCFIKLIMLKMYFVDKLPMKIVLTL